MILSLSADPVFYTILLYHTKVFLFLQDSMTYTILLFFVFVQNLAK